jgi:hypothetical protein
MSIEDQERSDELLIADIGQPPYERRLTDKILIAFNHALALGYVEIAERLHLTLEIAEREGVKKYGERRGVTVLDLAGLWRAFIAARDHFVRLSADPAIDPARLADARSRMRERWRLWENFNGGVKKIG